MLISYAKDVNKQLLFDKNAERMTLRRHFCRNFFGNKQLFAPTLGKMLIPTISLRIRTAICELLRYKRSVRSDMHFQF